MSLKYRPEIDGLRTVAVGLVILYHAQFQMGGPALLPGGFLGVDVFFVLSGYLITALIHQEWARTGRFRVTAFYERRARRLLPALFVVIFASWPFAWVILMPSEIMDMVRSQVASVFFVSNMFWWDAALTYGARAGELEPFLHTWSLAVEEQFYLVFPLAYLVLLRRGWPHKTKLWILTGTVLAGLIFAQAMSAHNWNLSFYWLPSRIWELLAGAALAHLHARTPEAGHSAWALRWLPLCGMLMILLSAWHMNLQWQHPGFGTLATVLGTVLILWFTNPRDPVTRLLSSRPFVSIGLISYSLYLWHYPIFAFGRQIEASPGLQSKLLWIALSIILAVLSYRFVERPFRDRQAVSLRGICLSGASAVVCVVAFATAMLWTDGLRERFPAMIAAYGVNDFDNYALRDRSRAPLNALAAAHGFAPSMHASPSEFERHHDWFSDQPDRHKILLVGNSHSQDMFNVFTGDPMLFADMEFARFGMAATFPNDQIASLLASPNFQQAETIVVSSRYHLSLENMPAFLQAVADTGKKIVVLLNTAEFEMIAGLPPFDWYLQKSGNGFAPAAINELAWEHRATALNPGRNEILRHFAAAVGATVLDRADYICTAERENCAIVTDEGYKALYDYGHYTLEGAAFYARVIARTGWFDVSKPQRTERFAME